MISPRRLLKIDRISVGVSDPQISQSKLDYYRRYPHYPQKSPEWLQQRNNYITASQIHHSLSPNETKAYQDLLLTKVSNGRYASFQGNQYTQWGVKYEPMAQRYYAHRYQTVVHEFGLIPHRKYPMLAVSPDGITDKLVNLEIKCPARRIPDNKIPVHYWQQIQLQMEVLDIDETDYLECVFEEQPTDAWYQQYSEWPTHERGIILEYIEDQSLRYKYSPPFEEQSEYKEWIRAQTTELNLTKWTETYWFLRTASCSCVVRNQNWFQQVLPKLEKFWTEVLKYRELGVDQLLQDYERVEPEVVLPKHQCLLLEENEKIPDDDLPKRQCLL